MKYSWKGRKTQIKKKKKKKKKILYKVIGSAIKNGFPGVGDVTQSTRPFQSFFVNYERDKYRKMISRIILHKN